MNPVQVFVSVGIKEMHPGRTIVAAISEDTVSRAEPIFNLIALLDVAIIRICEPVGHGVLSSRLVDVEIH